ncbi:hypothetical protein JB92DRAFT_3112420 [Gautieria morchelliformis]|nr:hypothetical protein JB92DRAFT_3112420 [Gautieria morchelliformis]
MPVAPCKLIIQVLFVILLVFMVQGNAAPIPLEGGEVSSGLSLPDPQSSSQDSTSFLSHGPKDDSVPEAAVGVVHVPDSQLSSECDIFAGQAHPAAHAAPVSLEGREVCSGLSRPDPQNPSQDSTSLLSHGPKYRSVPEAAVVVVHLPESQPSSESDIFAGQAHPATRAAPVPLEGREVCSGISRPDPQNPCQDSTSFLSQDHSVPEAAVGVVHVPESQPSSESDIFAGQAHSAAHAAPIPLEGGEVSSGLSRPDPQNSSQDSTSFLSQDHSVPEAAVGVVHVLDSQPSSESDIFAGQAHSAAHAAPMPLEGGEVSSGLSRPDSQNPCQDSTSFLSHGPKVDFVPEAAVGVVHVPESHEDKPSHESDIFAGQAHPAAAHSFLSTHLALAITLCTATLSALCVGLYFIIRCCRKGPKASQNDDHSAQGSDQTFDTGDSGPATPKIAEPIQAHLEPLTEYPRLVYVPPTPRDGKQPLFGHYLSPCGKVVGVKDTWMLAKSGGAINPDGSQSLVKVVCKAQIHRGQASPPGSNSEISMKQQRGQYHFSIM